jgi:hypothetical protein
VPKVTNVNGLPEALVRAVQNDPYNRGACDYSVTQLLKPARMVALGAQHRDELEEDVADRIWALMGQLGHLVLERAGVGLVEKRFFAERRGIRISGALDLVNGTTSSDWKFTSTYTTKDGPKWEWLAQTNIGRWLAAENGVQVDELEIVAIYRDWSKPEARRDPSYPQQAVQVFKLPVWPMGETLEVLDRLIHAHESAKTKLPLCTDEERWMRTTGFAVVKEGNTRATKVCSTMWDATAHAEKLGPQYKAVVRKGEPIRCQSYCSVAKFCTQFQAMKEAA